MKVISLFVFVFGLRGLCSYADEVFYEVTSGENYEIVEWKKAANEKEYEKAFENGDVFQSYTVEKKDGKINQVERMCTSPSGDWVANFSYSYNDEGGLSKLSSRLVTFLGIDAKTQEASITQVETDYEVTEAGKLKKVSERITDPETGKEVKRTCYMPEIEHWMKAEDIPKVGS